MKHIVEHYAGWGVVFRSLKPIPPKELNSRKKIEIYIGVDTKEYYAVVMRVSKKSRVLKKEAAEFIELHARVENYIDSKIKKKYIWIEAPLCSKAKKLLEECGWVVDVGK